MFARGVGVDAIGLCLALNSRLVEVRVMGTYVKMSASLDVPRESLGRREMYTWLSARGQLLTDVEVEGIVASAVSAVDGVPAPPASLPAKERDRLRNRLAVQRATLDEALRTLRGASPEEN